MNWFRSIFKEVSLLAAFVVLGAIMLTSFWITQNVNQNLFSEYKFDRVSVVVEGTDIEAFKAFAEASDNVVRYQVQTASQNKDSIREVYPELSSVLESLEQSYFPSTATLSVKNADLFLNALKAQSIPVEAQIIHQPPSRLKNFLSMATLIFSCLWILALVVVLYFQLERLAYKELQTWSLMKMLGAKATSIFWPICAAQILRVAVASIAAVGLSYLAAREFEAVFQWSWSTPSWLFSLSFVALSVLLASLIFLGLFSSKYRRVALA